MTQLSFSAVPCEDRPAAEDRPATSPVRVELVFYVPDDPDPRVLMRRAAAVLILAVRRLLAGPSGWLEVSP